MTPPGVLGLPFPWALGLRLGAVLLAGHALSGFSFVLHLQCSARPRPCAEPARPARLLLIHQSWPGLLVGLLLGAALAWAFWGLLLGVCGDPDLGPFRQWCLYGHEPRARIAPAHPFVSLLYLVWVHAETPSDVHEGLLVGARVQLRPAVLCDWVIDSQSGLRLRHDVFDVLYRLDLQRAALRVVDSVGPVALQHDAYVGVLLEDQ